MIKAIISFLYFIFFAASAYAVTPTLESFSTINISPSTENIIFTFDRINHYRFIMLSNDYWYIAVHRKIIHFRCKPKHKLSIEKILIRNIRKETRIYVKMDHHFKYKYRLLLSANKKYLIVRVEKNIPAEPPIRQAATQHTPVVVIDPGHGGKDPGAIGIYNKEKNIVLYIAKRTAYYLKHKQYKVFLTRTKDTYPTLADRAQLANRVKADIFVSIHANYALRNREKARGLEVYFLNTTSDKRAIRLAARENNMPIKQVGDINKIIVSLIQSSKIDKSKVLASYVYKNALEEGKKIYKKYKGRGVKQAPFYVLVDTHCPSILIETAFINNPQDALYLRNASFKNRVALGISNGIEEYIKLHLQSTKGN